MKQLEKILLATVFVFTLATVSAQISVVPAEKPKVEPAKVEEVKKPGELKGLTNGRTTPEGWVDNYNEALEQARATKRPVLLMFTGSDWCGWCKKMHAEVLSKPAFMHFAKNNLILVYLDFPRNRSGMPDELIQQNKKLSDHYDVGSFPFFILFTPNGAKLQSFSGYDANLLKKLEHQVRAYQKKNYGKK